MVEEVWEDEYEDAQEFDNDEAPDLPYSQISCTEERDLVTWIVIFILQLQAKYYIPDVALHCLDWLSSCLFFLCYWSY